MDLRGLTKQIFSNVAIEIFDGLYNITSFYYRLHRRNTLLYNLSAKNILGKIL